MKLKSITISNIGLIKNEKITIDKPLMLFYGDIKQGKTTILNCIRWAFGGSFPKDILTHGEEEGFIELELERGLINRSFYVNREGITTARDAKIILNNRPAKVNDIKRYLNPFLLNQNHLVDMKDSERNKFIVELFEIDTEGLDSEIMRQEVHCQNLRSRLKVYGNTIIEHVQQPDIEKLLNEKALIENEIQEQRKEVEAENFKMKASFEEKKQDQLNAIISFNDIQKERSKVIENGRNILNNIYTSVKGTIFEKCFDIDCAKRLLDELPKAEALKEVIISIPEPLYLTVDESGLLAINEAIKEAEIQQVRYESYLEKLDKENEKMKLAGELKSSDETLRCMRLEKAAKQEKINGIIEGLEYKDYQLWYENTSFEMLSTSQVMSLSSKLSTLYKESFGLELIDRGESMGKSIMTLVEKAEKEEKNILVTVVGEKPAEVPDNIGVFVVYNGEIL